MNSRQRLSRRSGSTWLADVGGPALLALIILGAPALPRAAPQLVDRVVARVDGSTVTLTDVRAAIALGVVTAVADADPVQAGIDQLVDRQLLLAEVQRFPPQEPAGEAIGREAMRLKTTAGAELVEIVRSTGLTDARIRDIARDNLRIAAYVDQRFGTQVQVSDEEVAAYYRAHQADFGGADEPGASAQVEPMVRQRASEARRRANVAQWLHDLRVRADVVITATASAP